MSQHIVLREAPAIDGQNLATGTGPESLVGAILAASRASSAAASATATISARGPAASST